MDPDTAFKELTRRTGATLRAHGFKGSGQNFKRDKGEQWQGINIQKSQWRLGREDPIDLYLNLCIYFPRIELERFFPAPADFSKYSPMKADLQFRLDNFLTDDDDAWLKVDADALEPFWQRFETMLTTTAIPAMDRMLIREGLADTLRTMPWMTTHAARLWLGKLAPPPWDPKDRDAGLWKQDERGHWWGPGEH